MAMIDLTKNQPVIIGLAGKAGSGKTSVAENIVPKGSIETFKYGIKWDHIFYALPLYEMASIKTNIKGYNEKTRKMYAIHDTLYDLYGGSSLGNIPEYDELVELVKKIYDLDLKIEGTKPRDFLQKAGDICRSHNPDCFAQWAIMKSSKIYRSYVNSLLEEETAKSMAVIISDVRCKNEAEHIVKQPNGFIVCFEASEETLTERLLKRDGKKMDAEHASHHTENEIEEVKKLSSFLINTDGMTLEEQTEKTLQELRIKELTNA